MKTTLKFFSIILIIGLALTAKPVNQVFADANYQVTPASTDWVFQNDNGTTGDWSAGFEVGPGTPPLGTGSATIELTSSGAGIVLAAQKYQGVRLADITTLRYSTYTNLSPAAMTFQFNYDPDVTTIEASTWYGRITYEPYMNGTVTNGVWQTWDLLNGGNALWWASPNGNSTVDDTCPQSAPCTLTALLAAFPEIGIRNDALSAVQFKAGSNWSGFTGNIDNLVFATAGNTDTYDFETVHDWYVSNTGSDSNTGYQSSPFATIQHAIAIAVAGDTIHVEAGKYVEDVNVNKGIILSGAGASTTSIVGTTGSATPLFFSSTGATVSGFTITHEYTPAELAAWTFNNSGVIFGQLSSGNTLRNCTVSLNRNGIYLNTTQNNTVDGNLITNNRTGINTTGIINGTQIINNMISNNWTLGYVYYQSGGGTATDFSTVSITGNTFDSNWYSEVLVKDAGNSFGIVNLNGNTFTDVPKTFSTSASTSFNEPSFANQKPNVPGIGGSAVKPTFEYPTIRIYNSSAASLELDGTAFMVAPDQTIQAAIDAAASGDTILVAPGTYTESLHIVGKNIILKSAVAGGATIQSPATIPPESTFTTSAANKAIIYLNNTTSTIDGFIIDGLGRGNANYRFMGVAFYNAGGGIQNSTIKNVQDTPFNGSQHGNAIYAYNTDSIARTINVSSNTVFDFQKNGITMNGADLTASVANNTVTCKGTIDVTAQNGIQFGWGSSGTITNNTVTGCSYHNDANPSNWGAAGIILYGNGPVTITNNTISGNSVNLSITDPVGAVSVGANTFGSVTGPLGSSYQVINDSSYPINLTQLTVDGVVLSDATTAQLLTVAGRIWDGIDDDTLGVALLKNGYQFVDPEGSIQAAIDAATAGDKIFVAAGTYEETGPLTINKANITVQSFAGAATTIIDVQGTGLFNGVEALAGLGNVTLDGFTVRNFTQDGIKQSYTQKAGTAFHVLNNIVIPADDYLRNGIEVTGDGSTVIGNTVYGKLLTTDWASCGIQVDDASNVEVVNNTIQGDTIVDYGICVAAWDFNIDDVLIQGNTITHANTAIGMMTATDAPRTISNISILSNVLSYSTDGISATSSDDGSTLILTLDGLIKVETNQFTGISGNDLYIGENVAKTGGLILDSSPNWWGQSTGPTVADILSDAAAIPESLIGFVPYCTNAKCTEFGYPPVHNTTRNTYYYTIQSAVADANSGDTLEVANGTYVETGQIVINKDLTIIGGSQVGTIIQPAQDTIGGGDTGSWILVNQGVTLNISFVTLDGTGRSIRQGIRTNGHTVVDHVTIKNIIQPGYMGFAVVQGYTNTVPQSLTVTNSTIFGFGRVGIQVDEGLADSTATITNNVITCRGAGDMVNYGITVEGGATATITGNTITNCYGKASVDGSESAAIEVSTYFAPGTTATIFGNFLFNNVNGILIGYDAADTSVVNAENNKIYNIDESAIESSGSGASVDASPNWWGTAVLPLISPKVMGTVTYQPYWVDEAMTILSSETPVIVFVDDDFTPASSGGHIWGYDAFATINGGIAGVATGGTVTVADGTYNEAVIVDKAGVTLHSVNGRAATIIDVPNGTLTTGIRVLGTGLGTVTIDGFTVRDFTEGGIIQGMASRTGTTVHFLNNELIPAATYLRNGIQVTGDGSTVIGNIVHSQYLTVDWSSTAIGVVDASNVTVQNNTVTGVGNYGIAVYVYTTSMLQSNVQVLGNTIDGIDVPLAATAYNNGTVNGVNFELNKLTHYEAAIEAEPGASGLAVLNIDATHNWWGSRFGPQGPVYGTPAVIKWCATAACTTFLPDNSNVVEATSSDSQTGAIKIYVPHITILLKNGTVIQNSSPCFEIYASYTTITTESIGGAQCVPTSDANAIEIADDLVNIVIQGIEFVGDNGTDGLHFAGTVTDTVLVDNWFHNFKGDGIEFAEPPTGIIDIQGNLFQNNNGVGIRNTTGTTDLPATYNSWGDVAGPTGPNGDEVSTFVTYAPFTHVDLYLVSSGSLVANQVLSGQTITYTVYAHVVNANAVDFRISYPANLTRLGAPVNSGTFTDYAIFDTSVPNTIRFYGLAPLGTAVTGNVPVFQVTFTAGAPIVAAPMNLDETTDAFGMIPYRSSSNIYAAALNDGTVTILASSSATGTLSMQGRSTRLGIPVTLTSTELIPWGPYLTTTLNQISNNLVFSNVAGGTYLFTTNQPRYLNVSADLAKTALITSNKVFPSLELKGGNAVWTDNVININDASIVGFYYGSTDPANDGDVNFDSKINIQDLAMVGGNFYLESADAYASWDPD